MYSTAPADWATSHSLGKSYSSVEKQSVYSTVPADWNTRHSLGQSYSSVEKQSVYSTAPADWATRHSLGQSYSSVEKQSVYSTAPADWEKVLGRLFPSLKMVQFSPCSIVVLIQQGLSTDMAFLSFFNFIPWPARTLLCFFRSYLLLQNSFSPFALGLSSCILHLFIRRIFFVIL